MSFEKEKRAYARSLACFADAGVDGLNHRTFAVKMDEKFDKFCHPITADVIFRNLEQVGFIQKLAGSNYAITEKGRTELRAIEKQAPERLKRSTSPNVPMYA